MKKTRFLTAFASLVLVAFSLSAMTSKQAIDLLKASVPSNATPAAVTNSVESAPVQVPAAGTIESTPSALPGNEMVAAGSFARPNIAVGANGKIFVAAEGPGMRSVWRYTTTGTGAWKGRQFVQGTLQTALRTYVVNIIPGGEDGEGIFCWRYGPKDGGKLHGPGVFRDGKETFENISIGCARLAVTPDGPILMSRGGVFKNLTTGAIGHYNAGDSGEKLAFAVSPNGKIWATAGNGCRELPSPVSINGQRQTWADYGTYGQWYGGDMNYPSVAIASDGSVWCVSVLGGRLRAQHIVNGKCQFPTTALRDLGDASVEERHAPPMVVSGAKVWCFYRIGKDIYRINVAKPSKGKERIASGEYPAVARGPDGRIHLVYVSGGSLHYKTLEAR
ncbi:MAG: hypothetical protein ACOYOU_01040 [Kiritimatiellia bacterium]